MHCMKTLLEIACQHICPIFELVITYFLLLELISGLSFLNQTTCCFAQWCILSRPYLGLLVNFLDLYLIWLLPNCYHIWPTLCGGQLLSDYFLMTNVMTYFLSVTHFWMKPSSLLILGTWHILSTTCSLRCAMWIDYFLVPFKMSLIAIQLVHFTTVRTMGDPGPLRLTFSIPHLYMSGDCVSLLFYLYWLDVHLQAGL